MNKLTDSDIAANVGRKLVEVEKYIAELYTDYSEARTPIERSGIQKVILTEQIKKYLLNEILDGKK
jgi:hypothetical protein